MRDPRSLAESRSRYATTCREGIHQLRHYFASVMLGGVSIKELARYLGHADPAFSLRVYGHLLPSSHGRAHAVINDRFSHLMTVPRPLALERQATENRDQSHGTETEQA
jgi:integrase